MYKIKDIEDRVLALNDPKLTRGINAIKLLSNNYAEDDPDAKKADGLLMMTIKEKHPEILEKKKEPTPPPVPVVKKVIKVKMKSPPKPAEKKQEPISKDDSTMTGSQVARGLAKIDHKIKQAQHSGIGALKNLYSKWEDENNHSENYLLLAMTVGSADDIQWADAMLKKHYELGFLPPGSGEERDAMNKKLWPKWLEYIGAKKTAPAASSAGKKKIKLKIKPKTTPAPESKETTKPVSLDECKEALRSAHYSVVEKKKGSKKIKIGKKRPDRNIITDKVHSVFKTVGNNLSEKEDATIVKTKDKIESAMTRIFQAIDKLMQSKDEKTLLKVANFFESLAEGKKATAPKFAKGGNVKKKSTIEEWAFRVIGGDQYSGYDSYEQAESGMERVKESSGYSDDDFEGPYQIDAEGNEFAKGGVTNGKTRAIFLYNEENKDLFAYFPDEDQGRGMKSGYSHIGQHSSVHSDYAMESRQATEEEYKDLKAELESMGYNLKVVNRSSMALGGRMKSGLMRDRKYFNKNQGHERAYNKVHGPRKKYGS